MENSESEVFDKFKVPQLLHPNEPPRLKHADSDNDESSDLKKSDNSDQKKTDQKATKSRADVPLPYKEPSWSGLPPTTYSFEIIKNGTFVETYSITSSLIVFGRLDVCNIVFEHPSVSRYHAVVQYCQGDDTHAQGFYLYDLGSTHGTFLNKEKITPKIYYKLKVGYILKFGGSTRLHIFQGPEEEVEEKPSCPKTEEDTVCNWGMGEDAQEEEDLTENPFALSTPNEELYLDDPKKTLKNWFEREGYELEYDVEEKGFKTFMCRIQLPIDTPTGDFMPVEASVTGKKKEAVIACALEACRTLDRLGLLRQSNQESRQRRKKKWEENDYYDSDEDTFLDRTGTIEKKREMRKRAEKKTEAETFKSIEAKLKIITEEISEISEKLSSSKSNTVLEKNSEVDTLEAYMSSLSDSKEMASDKIERRKLRFRLQEAEKEKAHLEKLLDIARPAKLPTVVKHPGMIGKKLKSKLKLPNSMPEETAVATIKLNENEEEIEESDSESVNVTDSSKDINASSSVKIDYDEKQSENTKKYGLITSFTENEREIKMDSDKKARLGSESEREIKSDSESQKKTELSSESEMCSKKRAIGCEKQDDVIDRQVSAHKKKKKNKKSEPNVDVYTVGNVEYSTWVPPSGQTGDGMTHLNAKYGY